MDASHLASVLNKLASGAKPELTPDEVGVLRAAEELGLVAEARPDPAATTRLRALRERLIAARGTDAEAALRSEILELGDRVAESSGGIEVLAAAEGAYRGTTGALGSFHLTQAGRALLGDLGPRAARATGMTYPAFTSAVAALRAQLGARAARATEILKVTVEPQPLGAARLAALGAAARGENAVHLGTVLRQLHAETANTPLAPAERWAAAESAVLSVGGLEDGVAAVRQLVTLRNELFGQYAHGRSEDALDAAVLLLPWAREERTAAIQRAATLAGDFRGATGQGLSLSLALVIERARPGAELAWGRLVSLHGELTRRGVPPEEATAAAALLSLSDSDPAWLVDRTVSFFGYVSRFSPIPLWAASAALALLENDVAHTIDDLRIASAATQRHLGAASGAEAIGLAIKLLLLAGMLGLGNEGDPEESLVLRPSLAAATRRLGTAGLATSLPLALPLGAAFHQPLLTAHDVALSAAPMHSSYVYGSGGGYHRSWG